VQGVAVPSRTFAAAGGKPAIQLFGVSGRYATALYAAGGAQVASIESELKSIAAARKADPKFEIFISDPTLSNTMKLDTFKAIVTKGGYSDTTAKFLSACRPARVPRSP
jgi:F0F1-type ATP synthase delta subunit